MILDGFITFKKKGKYQKVVFDVQRYSQAEIRKICFPKKSVKINEINSTYVNYAAEEDDTYEKPKNGKITDFEIS